MKKWIKEYAPALTAVLWSIIFISIFSFFTSPFAGPAAGSRVSLLRALGRAMNEGRIMYRDLFDERGPLLFSIQALGELASHLPGGIFFIQCCFCAATAVYLLRICELQGLGRNKTIFVFAAFYVLYAPALSGGDTSGEFVLPLALQSLYATLVYIKLKNWSFMSVFIPGFMAGLALMADLRFLLVFLIFPGIALIDMAKRGEKNSKVGLFTLIYLLGLVLPLVFYIAVYSQPEAIAQLFSCMCSALSGMSFGSLMGESGSLLCYGGLAVFFLRRKRSGDEALVLVMTSVLTWLFLHLGMQQAGDGIMVLLPGLLIAMGLCDDIRQAVMGESGNEKSDVEPVTKEAAAGMTDADPVSEEAVAGMTDADPVSEEAVAGPEALDQKEVNKLLIPAICIQLFILALAAAMAMGRGWDSLADNTGSAAKERCESVFRECREVYSYITPGESIYYMDVDPLFYEANRTYPQNRYLGEVTAAIARDPKAELDILTDLYPKKDGSSPRWIVQGSSPGIDSENIRLIMEGEYEEAYRTARFILWRRKK